MKAINPPHINDTEELQLLAENTKLGSYPELLNNHAVFIDQYEKYTEHGGDPWSITSKIAGDKFKKSLITHYDNAPKGRLEFIDHFRRKLSPNICPMCGGPGNGTLDHYLPKDLYPEFSFYSKNLIPACNCNSLRGIKVKGNTASERAIHPFFDTFLGQRLYTTLFEGMFETPKISIVAINDSHPQIGIIQFHLNEVINNDATQGWFEKHWSDLSERAHDLLDLVLPQPPQHITGGDLKSYIERYRNAKDKEYDTPNNWYSIFYTGLINDQARLDILAQKINNTRQ